MKAQLKNNKLKTPKALMVSCILLAMQSICMNSYAAPVVEKRSLSTSSPNQTNVDTDQTSTEWQLYQKILVLDEEIKQLRDKVERAEAIVARAEKKQKQRDKSLNLRIQNQEDALIEVIDKLEGNNPNKENTLKANTNNEPATNKTNTNNASPNKANANKQTVATLPQKIGTMPAANNLKKAVANAKVAAKKPQTNNKKQNNYQKETDESLAKKAYLAAYSDYRKKGKMAGVRSMSKFINTYPKSKLIPSAHFWIGEFYLSGKPDLISAELSFNTLIQKYPNSQKVPKSLYRLGYIAHLNKQNKIAKKYMNEILTKHPKAREVGLANAFLKRLK